MGLGPQIVCINPVVVKDFSKAMYMAERKAHCFFVLSYTNKRIYVNLSAVDDTVSSGPRIFF